MKNKGFTLIELLAVVVIIGLLAVIIIPKVKSTIDDSRKNSRILSVQSLDRMAGNYYLEKKAQTNKFTECTYNFTTNQKSCSELDFTGDKPKTGFLNIDKNGQVDIAVQYEDMCYIKNHNKEEIEIIPYDEKTCNINAYVFKNYELPPTVIQGDGLYKSTLDENRYIYKGDNPNNFIWIDENNDNIKVEAELYRIISFEKDNTITAIRNNSIGQYAWDERVSEEEGPRLNSENTYCQPLGLYFGCNVWGNQNNTKVNNNPLNNTFYFNYYPESTSIELEKTTEKTVTQDSTLNTYLNSTWLNENEGIKNAAIDSEFNVGGVYYHSAYTYKDKKLIKEKEEIKQSTWNGKIGLIQLSDYVETSTNNKCTSLYSNYYYNEQYYFDSNDDGIMDQNNLNWECSKNNWLLDTESEWTITANPKEPHIVWSISKDGYIITEPASNELTVRPVIHIKSSYSLTGQGTSDIPYELTTK